MTKRWLPLTYKPKIEPVCKKEITQTIRVGSTYKVGDEIAFHGWENKPYRSPWSFRTPYFLLNYVKNITILEKGIIGGFDRWDFDPDYKEGKYGDTTYRATLWLWEELNWLAIKDGIKPLGCDNSELLGFELERILWSLNGRKPWPKNGTEAQIIRWIP
jgi:hypothetical protein